MPPKSGQQATPPPLPRRTQEEEKALLSQKATPKGCLLLFLVVVGAAVVTGVSKEVAKRVFSRTTGNTDLELFAVAHELNSSLPMALDKDTRLDSVVALQKTLQYQYTLINYTCDQLDASDTRQALRSSMLPNIQSNPSTSALLRRGVSMEFRYSGSDGRFICSFVITPQDCKNRTD